jgi:hypothetical protein
MAFSPDALAQAHANPDLHLVAVSKPWEIFQVSDSAEVAPLTEQPAVFKNPPKSAKDWLDVSVDWYQQDPQTWAVPLAADGPSSWQRITVKKTPTTGPASVGAGVQIQQALRIPVRATKVSHIRTGDDRISFDVDRPGSPVLVKASYFPNWQASGAQGPWRVTPNLMVVVPTSKHVTLHYGFTAVDRAGWAVTLLGILVVIGLARWGPVPMPEPEAEPADETREQQLELDLARV